MRKQMNLKCNQFIYVLLLVFGMFTVFRFLQSDTVNFFVYLTSAYILWRLSVSDIKTRTISALMANKAIVLIYLLRICTLCILSSGNIPGFIVESLIVLLVFKVLSKFLRGKIGNGDFDVAYIIYLSIGMTGLFYSFVIACLLSIIFSLKIILKEHKNLKSQSVPFIPYLYMGYMAVLLIAKEMIFI